MYVGPGGTPGLCEGGKSQMMGNWGDGSWDGMGDGNGAC